MPSNESRNSAWKCFLNPLTVLHISNWDTCDHCTMEKHTITETTVSPSPISFMARPQWLYKVKG